MSTTDDKDHSHRYRHVNVRLLDPNPPTTGAQYHPPPPKPNPSSRFLSLLLKFVVMAFIISLFLLFLGVAAVALLHIFVAGSILRRRRTSSAEDLQKLLPRFPYAAVLHETGRDCVVCLESFKEGEWCRSLPTCNHMFHENCVDNWLIKVPNCPICRTGVRLDSGASSSVMADNDYKLLWAVGI